MELGKHSASANGASCPILLQLSELTTVCFTHSQSTFLQETGKKASERQAPVRSREPFCEAGTCLPVSYQYGFPWPLKSQMPVTVICIGYGNREKATAPSRQSRPPVNLEESTLHPCSEPLAHVWLHTDVGGGGGGKGVFIREEGGRSWKEKGETWGGRGREIS